MADNSPQEQPEEIAEEQERSGEMPEENEIHNEVLKRRWLIALILAVVVGSGIGALFYPVRLNEKSDVEVPLINYIKYKLFVTPRPELQKLPEPPPQPLDEMDKIPDFQCPEGEICADG
jgi:hypothetical protein